MQLLLFWFPRRTNNDLPHVMQDGFLIGIEEDGIGSSLEGTNNDVESTAAYG